MAVRRRLAAGVAVVALIAALAYLRDPPWLIHVTSGLRGWEQTDEGTRYRWMNGHASFFVPADKATIDLPLRAIFERPSDWPINAEILVDDVTAARVAFEDERWQVVRVGLPSPGSRRVRRIDIRVDRTRSSERGLQVGEVRY